MVFHFFIASGPTEVGANESKSQSFQDFFIIKMK